MVFLPAERRSLSSIPTLFGERGGDFPRLLDRWFEDPFRNLSQNGLWHPALDVYDRPKEIVVQFEIPDIDPKDIEISVEKDHLTIEGTRTRSDDFKDDDLQYSERSFGGFHRIVHLRTRVDSDKAVAGYDNGVLTVTLPKAKEVIGRKIPLKIK